MTIELIMMKKSMDLENLILKEEKSRNYPLKRLIYYYKTRNHDS